MRFFVIVISLFCMSCGHTYYIVRHAEKEASAPNMTSDVPLTKEGQARAEKIKDILQKKDIQYVFSTNFIRTRSTAQPVADYFHLSIASYGPRPDSLFIANLRSLKANALIVGHSNTVDEVVNGLCGKKKVSGDLDESGYNKLFVVKVKGKKVKFEERKIY